MRLLLKLTRERRPLNVNEIEDEYNVDFNDIFNEDSDMYRKLIWIINNHLTTQEKNILLHYAETQRQKDTAKALGVSTATVNCVIQSIRQKIIDKLYNKDDIHNS